MKKKVSKRALLIKALMSGAFFWILISFVQTNQLFQILSRVDWLYLVLSIVLSPVMLCVSCLKWKMVLDLQARKIPFFRLIRIYLIGYFFSNLLPSTVGGDVARSYYSGKIINNQSFSAIAIFIERFTGLFFLFFLVILAPLIKPDLYRSPYIYVPGIGAFVLLLIIFWIWRVQNPLALPHRLVQWVFSFLFKNVSLPVLTSVLKVMEKKYQALYRRLEKLHVELETAVTTIRRDRPLFAKIILITVIFYLLTWLNVYLAFMAFGVKPDFWGVCALVSTVLFVAQVPVTLLGNLGFFESVFVFYFLLIDIPAAETLAMGLLLRLKMLAIGGVGYPVYLSYSDARYIGEEFDQLEQSV